MLTGDLVRPRLRQYDGQLRVLLLESNRQQLQTAADLIADLDQALCAGERRRP